jgi:hypothetical protein
MFAISVKQLHKPMGQLHRAVLCCAVLCHGVLAGVPAEGWLLLWR